MTNHDVARWETAKRIQDFNQAYAPQLATIPDYQLEVDDLNQVLQQLDTAAAIQQQDNSGKTSGKTALRTALTDTLTMYTKRAVVKAHRLGNIDLEQGLDHSVTYYTNGTTAQCIARATAVKDLLKTNLMLLTNISAADITTIEAAITAFEAASDTPKTAGQTQKVYGTDQIDQLLDKADTLLDNMGNLVDSYFANSNVAAEFNLKSRLIELGTRSNSVTLQIQDATTATPITGAIATNESGTKTATSAADGLVAFESVRTGLQTFTVAAMGYATTIVKVKVARGTNTEIVVKMGKG